MKSSDLNLEAPKTSELIRWLQSFSKQASVVVIFIGCVVIIGWLFNITALKSVLPGLVSMKANSAVGFILGGWSLWLLHKQQASQSKRRTAQVLAVIVLLIGLLTLMEYSFGWDLGIDELLFQEPEGSVGTFAPGRMGANTALNFLMLGSALLLLTQPHPNYLPAQGFSLMACLIALLGFLGYAYGVESFYGIGTYTRMALHTAVAFMLLSSGILFVSPDRGLIAVVTSNHAGGIMAQRLFPAMIIIPPVLGGIILLGYQAQFYDTEVAISLLGVLNMVVFATLIWWNARSLGILDVQRQRAEEQSRLAAATATAQAEQLKRALFELQQTHQALNTAKEDLKDALGYLTAIINNLADGLLVTDTTGKISRLNPALSGMFGLEKIDPIGKDCKAVFSSELAELVVNTQKQPREIFSAEIELADDRVGQAVATTIHKDSSDSEDLEDDGIGSVILIRDITAEKQVDRMKTDFISTVSHELRTPLTSVLGFTKIIKKKLNDGIFPKLAQGDRNTQKTIQQVEENINIIVSEGERLTTLINDVLDIAKMEAGKVEWHMQPTHIAEIIERACTATRALFDTKGMQLIKEIPSQLPEVVGDRDRLIQVVINLISNAVKFTDNGSVTSRARCYHNEIVVSIIDTGIGIALDDQQKVFEKFKQVGDTMTDKPKGTGLGLPICKQIIEHHGGRIWVESQPSMGSNFSFTLPIRNNGDAVAEKFDIDALVRQLREHVVTATPAPVAGQKTILVVDDDAHIRVLLRQELEAQGYDVREATDGMDAISQVKQHHPDLIILDVMMPQINGFDVAAVLKNDPSTCAIPIIILSIIEDKIRGYRLGIDRYLTKPVNTEHLLSDIGSLLSQGLSKRKVLVVDEDADTVKILSEVLQAKGYTVVEASNSQECIEKALSVKPDMIIIDSVFSQQHNLVKTLRFENGLEHVLFILLGSENLEGDALG